MALCLAAGTLAVTLAVESFTLTWIHSIEKTRWEEDWRIAAGALVLVEARIRGSGAGMEPPDGAELRDGIWHYHPALPRQQELLLSHTPHAGEYTLCTAGRCQPLSAWLPGLAEQVRVALRACRCRGGADDC